MSKVHSTIFTQTKIVDGDEDPDVQDIEDGIGDWEVLSGAGQGHGVV